MSGSWRQLLLAIMLIVVFPAASSAEEAPTGINPSLVIEQFEIFKDGDALLVPVTVFEKTRLFVVDTETEDVEKAVESSSPITLDSTATEGFQQ